MSFTITGLSPAEFAPLFALSDEELERRGIIRKTATSKPGFPCRVTLEDAEPGETVLLLNYESHKAETPYRSSYAIYVRESASEAATYENELPPVFQGRPMAFRHFNEDGHLIGASLALHGDAKEKIEEAFSNSAVAYIHAHNAAHGCFAAEIKRGD
ncbi:DUF1203 domain-containing protein [Hyphococcus sp.]|jgi:hypothetical protein|uniref:DUF1203 domain-containing protein n=1 Tax=Hyphococcus sp. TaxID=2038636 RepID=UPI003D0D2071